MVFVREKIPEEYIKKHNIEFTDIWCIDKERDVIFYYAGGNPRGCEKSFLFIWQGQGIEIFAGFHPLGIGEQQVIEWRDIYTVIPEKLRLQKDEILYSIKDAFESFGFLGHGEYKTKVIFDKKMFIEKSESGHGNTRSH